MSTRTPTPYPCYTILRALRSFEVPLRFFLRSTSSPISYPCYTILRGLRSVEVRLRFILRSTSTPFPIPWYTFRAIEVFGDPVFIILKKESPGTSTPNTRNTPAPMAGFLDYTH